MNDRPHSSPRVADLIKVHSEDFRRQALEHPSDLSVWTKLYAASQTMLEALQEGKLSAAFAEICSNFLGCENVAVIEIQRETGALDFLTVEGLSPVQRTTVMREAYFLQSKIELGSLCASFDEGEDGAALSTLGINALVPLWRDQSSSGALVLFQLLPQRSGFDAEDREVLQFLTMYAGPCWRGQARG